MASYLQMLPRDVIDYELAPLLLHHAEQREDREKASRLVRSIKLAAFVLLILSIAMCITAVAMAWPREYKKCDPLICDWIPAEAYPWTGDTKEVFNMTNFCRDNYGEGLGVFWQAVIGNETGDLWPRGLFNIPFCCMENTSFCMYYSTEPPHPNGTICYKPSEQCKAPKNAPFDNWMWDSWGVYGGQYINCMPTLGCTQDQWSYKSGRVLFITLSSVTSGIIFLGVISHKFADKCK